MNNKNGSSLAQEIAKQRQMQQEQQKSGYNKFSQKGKIREVKSTIFQPEMGGLRIILNLCSNNLKFDEPFSSNLSKKWENVKRGYKEWMSDIPKFKLGNIYSTSVQSDVMVVSCLVYDKDKGFSEDAFNKSMASLLKLLKDENSTFHVAKSLLETVPSLKTKVEEFSNTGIHINIYSNN